MGLDIALLAYKEEENLRVLLPRIRQALLGIDEPSRILVVDTATPLDGTERVCAENGALYFNQEEPGFGGAFRTAIARAESDKFLILDSDASHDPAMIPALYRRFVQGADVVIGSRYVEGGSTHDAPVSVLLSRVLNGIFRRVIGLRTRDISTDFRIYRTEQLKRVTLEGRDFDVLQEVLLKLRLQKPDLVVVEVPVSFEKRLHGESKRDLPRFVRSYLKTLFRLLEIRRRERRSR